jgi:hypothetical protein
LADAKEMEVEGLAGMLPCTNDIQVDLHVAESLGAGGG